MIGFFAAESFPKQPVGIEAAGLVSRARAFFRARPDREHEIAANRLAMCVVFLSALAWSRWSGDVGWTRGAWWLDVFLVIYCGGLFLHMLRWPGKSPARRIIGIACDTLAIGTPMYLGGEHEAYLFPLLLWSIFGNGFRFGVQYLLIATAASISMFSLLVFESPYWSANLSLSAGLLAGLITLPLYTSVLIRQLSEAKRLAEESNKAKTLFLASVSHELRTPLNAIIGLSDLLTETPLDDEQVGMSRVIGRSGRSLLTLINSILDISRMEYGQLSPRRDTVDLFVFLEELREMLAVQASGKNLRLGLHIHEDTPRHLAFSRNHVEEILVNLVGNAIKFTERGFVMIRAGATLIDDASVALRVEVVDTGIGIAPEAMGKIFDRFSQADETIIDRFGGTGLGLAIAKQLAEGLGGTIGVESVVGEGSVFHVVFECQRMELDVPPSELLDVHLLSSDAELIGLMSEAGVAARVSDNVSALAAAVDSSGRARSRGRIVVIDARGWENPEAAIRDVRQRTCESEPTLVALMAAATIVGPELESMLVTVARPPFNRASIVRMLALSNLGRGSPRSAPRVAAAGGHVSLNVLVAEDNRTNQMVIRKILERGGHRATIVGDGQLALEKLNEERFDLALMDLNMPVLNGIDAANLYQFAVSPEDRAPIVALTADVTDEARQRCLEAGMIACITKPVEPARFIEWLDTFARERTQAARRGKNDVAPPLAEANDGELIDAAALDDLKSLGGETFVSEIVDQFLSDAAGVLKSLHRAVAEGNVQQFRDEAHALRSCAANVGALKVYKLCLESRSIDARQLAIEGELRIRRLEAEFERARDALAYFQRSRDTG